MPVSASCGDYYVRELPCAHPLLEPRESTAETFAIGVTARASVPTVRWSWSAVCASTRSTPKCTARVTANIRHMNIDVLLANRPAFAQRNRCHSSHVSGPARLRAAADQIFEALVLLLCICSCDDTGTADVHPERHCTMARCPQRQHQRRQRAVDDLDCYWPLTVSWHIWHTGCSNSSHGLLAFCRLARTVKATDEKWLDSCVVFYCALEDWSMQCASRGPNSADTCRTGTAAVPPRAAFSKA